MTFGILGAIMVSTVTKLPRLSRNKTTGNVIILVLIFIGVTFFLNVIGLFSSTIDQYSLLIGSIFSIFLSYLTDRKLRQPFFIETSRYLEELINRRYDVQQIAIQIELIDPLQKIVSITGVLKQINNLLLNLEEILNQTTNETSLNTPSIRNHDIQKELREITKLTEETLQEIQRKRKNIEFLAKIREIMLNSISEQISRPLNEIEFDYILYKVHKQMENQITDDYLLKQVFNHILSQGEIIGRLNKNNKGDLILSVERSYQGAYISNISRETELISEINCVICRHPIKSQEKSVNCPSCKTFFHRNHLLEWLKVFNQCPICHQRLTLFSNPT
ncbi:MAG: RING finger protein [Promethearchaeota archaeon]